MQTVENEFHFLLECSLYINERKSLIHLCQFEIESFGNLDPEDKFIEIMKNKKEIVIAALGKYINNCMIKQYKSDLNNNQQKQKQRNKRKKQKKLYSEWQIAAYKIT